MQVPPNVPPTVPPTQKRGVFCCFAELIRIALFMASFRNVLDWDYRCFYNKKALFLGLLSVNGHKIPLWVT